MYQDVWLFTICADGYIKQEISPNEVKLGKRQEHYSLGQSVEYAPDERVRLR
jgi:hypothetical protein